MRKIEHIGIAVKQIDAAIAQYENLLATPCYKREYVESENVHTAFFRAGPNKIELLSSDDPDNVINKYIEKKGEGIHHIAYDVPDIIAEMNRLKEEGFQLLQESPKKGADNKWICFIHPKSTHGVLTELCQEIRDGD
jgi:methylmalonyl-CoA/ethylmalonyl-CoA epimerase